MTLWFVVLIKSGISNQIICGQHKMYANEKDDYESYVFLSPLAAPTSVRIFLFTFVSLCNRSREWFAATLLDSSKFIIVAAQSTKKTIVEVDENRDKSRLV